MLSSLRLQFIAAIEESKAPDGAAVP